MAGYTKLFSSIITSTVWCENNATLRVWIAMLAMADSGGCVEGSIPGFANLARVTAEEMRSAVETLAAPDPESRTPDNEGRRIETIPGGWRILNYLSYRDRGQDKEGSRAPYMRQRRALQENVTRNSESVTRYTYTEAEADKETDKSVSPTSLPGIPPPPTPHEGPVEIWNRICVPAGYPVARGTKKQRDKATAKAKDKSWLKSFEDACSFLAGSRFHRGSNDRGWKATFGWLLDTGKLDSLAERLPQPKPEPAIDPKTGFPPFPPDTPLQKHGPGCGCNPCLRAQGIQVPVLNTPVFS